MSTDIVILSEAQFKQIVLDAVDLALEKHSMKKADISTDESPFGDLEWVCRIWPVPKDSIEQLSAKGKIPGKIKIGKRVIYEKADFLKWIRDHKSTIQINKDYEQIANDQYENQQSKKVNRSKALKVKL